MAGKITHLEVLSQVCKHLDHGTPEQKKIAKTLRIEENKNYANLGTVAPDIFYFYHVLTPVLNKKSQFWGDLSHHRNVAELLLNFLDIIFETEEGLYRDRFIAFTMGYLVHCIVDVVTHPYIFFISGDFYNKDPKISSQAQIAHMRVEYALDSYLLNYRWGMSPHDYDFPHHVDVRVRGRDGILKLDPMIWKFWQRGLLETFPDEFKAKYIGSENKMIPLDIINDSYIGFLRFNKVVDTKKSVTRNLLKFIDFVTFKKANSTVLMLPLQEEIDPRIMNNEGREWHYPADKSLKRNDSFITLVNNAANSAKDAVTLAWEYLNNRAKREAILKEYGGYNLDTGLKFQEITSMKEFSPL
ncbi:MAG: zinc dependent phospholipase C family protein [Leptospiraceae bacterium]|nr:zinc dependent phospholipase C family protein [Leptospiraceae bacterium]